MIIVLYRPGGHNKLNELKHINTDEMDYYKRSDIEKKIEQFERVIDVSNRRLEIIMSDQPTACYVTA